MFWKWQNLSIDGKKLVRLYNCTDNMLIYEADLNPQLCFTANWARSSVMLQNVAGTYQTSYDGNNWTDYVLGTTLTLANVGDKVYFKAKSQNQTCYLSSAGSASRFVLTGRIAASGNIQSLLDETCQRNDVPEYCYYSMFQGCSSLAQAPELPATTLAFGCYYSMFYNCDSLTQAPTLPATTLAVGCYSHMFFGCTNLTQAPELLATTLANSCYYNMFSSCTSLTQAPALPATTLASYCYYSMFSGCSRLKISENGNVGKKILDIPSGTTIYTNWNTNMFSNTAGTFKGDPQIGNSYWCY